MNFLSKHLVFLHHKNLFTFRLSLTVFYMALASFNYGYDISIFANVQAMQPFAKQFGEWSDEFDMYQLPSYLSSIMNSMPFLGKLVGALCTGPIIDRWGRKVGMLFIAGLTIIGALLQTTATTPAQFVVGRIVCYAATGICINSVPLYLSESAPPAIRGASVTTLQLAIGLGQTVGAGCSAGTRNLEGKTSYLIPVGLQFVIPAVIVSWYWFIPESPRWLVLKDRTEDAVKALKQLRTKDTSHEEIAYEIELIRLANEENQQKTSWKELFNGTNLRRTHIAVLGMMFQQVTGQAFVNQYATVFYQQQGITSPSPFVLNIIQYATGMVTSVLVIAFLDSFGRRAMIFIGGGLMTIWMFTIGGLGTRSEFTSIQKNVLIASVNLYNQSYNFSWAPLSYVFMTESVTNRLRGKTALLASSISVTCAFLVSFTVPYLVNPGYANLGAKVGFIYGSVTAASLVWTFFCAPEMKDRSLEEIDEMFQAKLPARQFKNYVSDGVGKTLTEAEDLQGFANGKKEIEVEEEEHV